MSKNLQKLKMFKDCLYHGSPIADIKALEPKQASDVDAENQFNNDLAVFASDNLCMSIIFSLVDKNKLRKITETYEWSVNYITKDGVTEICSEIPSQWREYLENASGYIYVLPKASFLDNTGSQFKSKTTVVPLDFCKVTLEDYYETGGKIEWTAYE